MKKEATIKEVFNREDNYYTEEYQKTWRNDLALLQRITKYCTKEEIQRLYDMINGETWEMMDMIQYIKNN